MKFNRIKAILQGMNPTQCAESMMEAVKSSQLLKLSKCKTKLKRRVPFDKTKIDLQGMNLATVYCENFPNEVTAEQMESLFKRCGTVRYVKLPRLPDGQLKGFCFIEFASA